MNVNTVLSYVALSLLLGAVGQGARMIVGLKKTSDEAQVKNVPMAALFDGKQLLVSLVIGAVAGGLAAIPLLDNPVITKETLMILITAGYAGADFIEGFMRKEDSGGTPKLSPSVAINNSSSAPINPFGHN